MSVDRPNPEAKPGMGEMPRPKYIVDAPSTVTDEMTKWIGVESVNFNGDPDNFLWWKNFRSGDLTDPKIRYELASFLTRLKIGMDADATIGPAVDLQKSNSDSGFIQTIEEPEVYGVYIQAQKRPMFNFFVMMDGVKSEEELRRSNPVEYDEVFQKAKLKVPAPIIPENQPVDERKLDERIKFVTGDLTEIEAEAIVCPSLPELDVLYTGVAGAIMRKGGDRIFAEARRIGAAAKREHPENKFPVPLYSAVLTNAGDLPNAKHVIHSVSVNFTEEDGLSCDPEAIFKSAWNVLEVANGNGLQSVAFPALGSGLYQVPIDKSFGAIAQAADRFLVEHPDTTIKEVIMVNRDPNISKPSLQDELLADAWHRDLRARRN